MRTIEWRDGAVFTVDQTRLPLENVVLKIETDEQMAEAIKKMRIRGAPLLGAASAFALALTAYHSKAGSKEEFFSELEDSATMLKKTRPTAVNLFWAIDQLLSNARAFSGKLEHLKSDIIKEAKTFADNDAKANRAIGQNSSKLIDSGDVILTHCNAGELATVEYGTALGVIRNAWDQGKRIKVFATETRPKLQGARLTVYELKRDGIPVTLITDGMVGYLMHSGCIDKVVVGADRIVKDAVINKIGTFTIAVLAKEHKIPFFVAAPKSTFDFAHKAEDIVIEERNPNEVTHIGSHQIAPKDTNVFNPAFDITPLKYVTAIIWEGGVYYKEDFEGFAAFS